MKQKATKASAKKLAAQYAKSVRWSEEDGVYVGTVHDLIGDCCHGSTPSKVFAECQEIALECVEAALESGDKLPRPVAKRNKGSEPDPRAIRKGMGMSQAGFAIYLGISAKTLHKWEQGTSDPSGAARSLLILAQREPHAVRRALSGLKK